MIEYKGLKTSILAKSRSFSEQSVLRKTIGRGEVELIDNINKFSPEVSSSSIVTVIGEFVAASMSEHMRMNSEADLCVFTGPPRSVRNR